MKSIKFSHAYTKMGDTVPREAFLMAVFKSHTSELHPRFVEYDTSYFDKKINNWAYYKLPEGDIIVLLLRSYNEDRDPYIWTIIRRFTQEKYEYYMSNLHEKFDIIMTQEA